MAKKAKKKPAKKSKPAKKKKAAKKKAKPAKKAAKKKTAKKAAPKKAAKKSFAVKIAPPSLKSQPMAHESKLSAGTSFMSGLATGAGASAAYSSFGQESKADDGEE